MLFKYIFKAPGDDPVLTPETNFYLIFNAALEAYEKTTKKTLLTHPLAGHLQSCDSPAAIVSVLGDLVQPCDQNQSDNKQLGRFLDPIVNVLFASSTLLDKGVVLVILKVFIS